MPRKKQIEQVFVNCPFDKKYWPLFYSVVFTVIDCGGKVRCALEEDNSGKVRIEKIIKMIRECRLGIHDISRTQLDPKQKLPRFNMPFELGLFMGLQSLGGGKHAGKSCLILDTEQYRYQIFLSDIAGQDIRAHHNNVNEVIKAVRNWMAANVSNMQLPSASVIAGRYSQFQAALPDLCRRMRLKKKELTFIDYQMLMFEWVKKIAP